jgi:HlyD family secretion protein
MPTDRTPTNRAHQSSSDRSQLAYLPTDAADLERSPESELTDSHLDPLPLDFLDLEDTEPPRSNRAWLSWRWLKFAVPIAIVLFAGGVGLRQLNSTSRSSQYLTQTVERQTIPVSISANGSVSAERSINLSPKSAGIITALLVKEGDRVTPGQPIAIMDDSNLRGQMVQMQGQLAQQNANLKRLQAGNRQEDIGKAEAMVAEARANLQQLKSGNRPQDIAQAKARVAQAQATLTKLQSDRTEEIAQAKFQLDAAKSRTELAQQRVKSNQFLRTEGAISQDKLNEVMSELRSAQASQEQAQRKLVQVQQGQPAEIAKQKAAIAEAEQALNLQLAGTRSEQIAQAAAKLAQQEQALALLKAGTRPEDIEQAKAQVLAAQGSLENIKAQMHDAKVVAPFAGFVTKKYADIGAFVSPSMGGGSGSSATSSSILTLSSDRHQLIVNISESQIGKIKPGQNVTLKVDAFPSEKFVGKVDRIAPKASVAQNVTSFEVYVALTYPGAEKLKAGMNAEAQFAIGNLENAMLVPNAAVVRQAQGEGVYVLNSDGQPIFQAISTGITTEGKTEVKTGLQGNERVLISPPSAAPAKSGGLFSPPKVQGP